MCQIEQDVEECYLCPSKPVLVGKQIGQRYKHTSLRKKFSTELEHYSWMLLFR
jgi:hypothetical protein